MPIVYIATNRINGKRYIGASKHTLDHRRKKHYSDARNNGLCRVFYAAIRKYGEAVFNWEVLVECEAIEDVIREEIRLITELRPEYNITAGGRGVIGVKRTPQWLERMSIAQKAVVRTDEVRNASRERIKSLHLKQRKSVVCLNDGRFFESAKDAASFYGMTVANVGAIVRGYQTVSKGRSFILSKVALTEPQCAEELRKLACRRDQSKKRRTDGFNVRPVICVDDNMLYPSVTAAARDIGVTDGAVRGAINRGSMSRGRSFQFLDEWCPNPL